MKQPGSQKADLLEHFYEHLSEEDWLAGVDLYQAGRVVEVQSYASLMTGKVVSLGERSSSEVRLKLHPSGRVIQWIECTCKKNRAYGLYCEHIAAFMIHVDREQNSVTKNLDIKMPLKPPTHFRKVRKPAEPPAKGNVSSDGKARGASQTLLDHLKGSIHSVALQGHGPCLRVRLEIKPGTITHYDLDIDASAQFLASHPRLKSATAEVKELRVLKDEVELGTRIYTQEHEKVVAERVLALKLKRAPKDDADESLTLSHSFGLAVLVGEAAASEDWYVFVPMKVASRNIGSSYVFMPGRGYLPLKQARVKTEWYDLPLAKTYKDDDAARFVQSGFTDYLSVGPLWVEPMLKQPIINELPGLSEVRIHDERDGWFRLDPTYGEGKAKISMVDLLVQARKKKRKFIKTGDTWLKIPEFITQHDWSVDQDEKFIEVDALGLLRLKAAVGDFDRFVGSKKVLQRIRDRIEYNQKFTLPSLDRTKLQLRGYQRDGFKWFWWLYQNQLHGLLADEMGLGKTHQAMALMSAIQEECRVNKEKQAPKFLVICPTTVLDHWEDKVRDFAPNLTPIKYHGAKRLGLYDLLKSDNDTLITSYGVLLRDIKRLSERKWHAVILDEAHFVKNNNTATYRAACKLDSKIRLCLTGTPMENHLGELKNLFDFLVPGYLGSDDYFRKQFILPIQEKKDVATELALQKLIHPLKLRRTKKQVLSDLPAKVEDIRHCGLSNEQVKLYREVINMKAKPLLHQLADDSNPVPYLHVFAILQMLKQVCNHPALLYEGSNYHDYESGKFELLKELLAEALDSGNKIVIFSQYVKMIKIIKQYCDEQGIGCVAMTGQSRNRGKLISDFQSNENTRIFAGSLLAGGVGIDLTSASVVIHYDRWWNASKENQATDRVHRIGQKKYVQVMKLVTRGTLEEKIDQMIAKKQSMFNKFLERDEEIFKTMSRQDLIDLLQ